MKNTIKTITIIILAYTILPTGDPTDLLITIPLINLIGLKSYLILAIVLILLLYKWIQGKTIKDKFNTIKREIKSIF